MIQSPESIELAQLRQDTMDAESFKASEHAQQRGAFDAVCRVCGSVRIIPPGSHRCDECDERLANLRERD